MKIISIKAHGVLDYVTVVAFAAIPSIFSLSGIPAYLSYTLAVVHLSMTLLTNFPLGVSRPMHLTTPSCHSTDDSKFICT